MSNILKGLNEGRNYGRDSWDSNMPGYQGDYGGAENFGRRNREWDEDDRIDARIRAEYEKKKEYEQNGKFWLKLKDSQRHLPAGPFTGKQAANTAAIELLKQQPELKGNLLITAYGPNETQGVAEGASIERKEGFRGRVTPDIEYIVRDEKGNIVRICKTKKEAKMWYDMVTLSKEEMWEKYPELKVNEGEQQLENSSSISDRKKIAKYEELALAANRVGDDEKCKLYQRKIQILKQKMSQGVAEGQLDELSNNTLASYKKKAGADATQADKRGDYARGNKRMSGIIKATKKEFDNDAKGVDEARYDSGDYYNARQGYEYGAKSPSVDSGAYEFDKEVQRNEPGGDRGRPKNLKGVSKTLPADAFGRITGKIPAGKTGRIHSMMGDVDEELDENLHKWFKEKWVRFGPDGKIRGDCARGDDSEGKPKCLPQSKAHSLGKKGRASAASRKRREDPNPERSGKAINVNTKKKSNESVSEGSLNETRNSLFAFVKQQFPTWPDYVLKDFLYQQAKGIRDQAELDDFLKRNKQDFGNCKWTLTKLPITFDIFTPKTQRMLASREGGSSNPFQVPRDAERHAQQSQMIQQKGVSAEPIIVAKLSNGYDLIEGWHRTIQHLKAFPQGYTGPAWVCTGATYKSESVEQGVVEGELDEACWKGYHKEGNKKMFGKTYPNCVKNKKTNEEQEVGEDARIARKPGQPAGSKKHSDLYTDENPKGTITGLKFATAEDARASVSKIRNSGRSHAHKIQAAVAMEQRAKAAGKSEAASVYRKYINATKKTDEGIDLEEACWDTHKQVGMKNKGGKQVPNCVPKESIEESKESCPECGGPMFSDLLLAEKQDACYNKVKSRYKVWPSAYASGALVQCRKKGAANWGTGGKKNESIEEDQLDEKWTKKYKDSINCSNPKGFSQKAHCAGKQKNESAIMKGLKL